MRYLVSYDFILDPVKPDPEGKRYKGLFREIRALKGEQVLQKQWIVQCPGTDAVQLLQRFKRMVGDAACFSVVDLNTGELAMEPRGGADFEDG